MDEADRPVELERAVRKALSAYRSRLPDVLAGLADKPGPGKKARAREALREHMAEMKELSDALSRFRAVPIAGSDG